LKSVIIIAIVAVAMIGFMVPSVFAVDTPTVNTSTIGAQQTATNLTDDSNSDRDPVVKVDGTNIHVAWLDQTAPQSVKYSVSTDSGVTFGSVQTLSTDGYAISTAPIDMAVVGDNVYIVWTKSNSGAVAGTGFIKSTDSGSTWSSASSLTVGERPSISADGTNVNVIGWGYSTTDDVKFIRSTDSGATFSATASSGSGGIVNAIGSSGSNIYIISRVGADSMKLIKSTDAGNTFATSTIGTGVDHPEIEISGSYLHVSFNQSGAVTAYRISDDSGSTWSSPLTITSDWGYTDPNIASGSNFHLSWRDDSFSGGEGQIYIASSSNDGLTFDEIQNISGLGVGYNAQEVSIGSSGTLVAAAFTACIGGVCDVYVTSSADSGTTFTPPNGTSTITHSIAAGSSDTYFDSTGITNVTIDVFDTTPSNDYTISNSDIEVNFAASTSVGGSNTSLVIQPSTKTIDSTTYPDATSFETIYEFGATGSSITFDNMVEIVLKGDSGTTPFYIDSDGTTNLITACGGSPTTAAAASSDTAITSSVRECYWASGSSGTKHIWTYHFTAFGAGDNFSTSTSTSTSSGGGGGGGNNCDSNGFGKDNSLRVYQVMYDIETNEVQVHAYSTCGSIQTKMTTPMQQSILGLSTDQPLLENRIAVYSGFLDESDEKFNISIQNKRDSFTETFYIYDKSITKKYTGDTGYTSEQQGTSLPTVTSKQTTVVSEPSVTQIVQTIKDPITIESKKQIPDEKSDILQSQSIGYTPEPVAEKEIKPQCGVGTKLVDGICKIIKPDEPKFCFLFWCW